MAVLRRERLLSAELVLHFAAVALAFPFHVEVLVVGVDAVGLVVFPFVFFAVRGGASLVLVSFWVDGVATAVGLGGFVLGLGFLWGHSGEGARADAGEWGMGKMRSGELGSASEERSVRWSVEELAEISTACPGEGRRRREEIHEMRSTRPATCRTSWIWTWRTFAVIIAV